MVAVVLLRKTKKAQQLFANKNSVFVGFHPLSFPREKIQKSYF